MKARKRVRVKDMIKSEHARARVVQLGSESIVMRAFVYKPIDPTTKIRM